ncbi:hypothetical protein [Lysinibacillus sp. SGAir0095]|uniref:hypothetical protein n=1 Tax=Lysinibacillus sp. SGAir0095 TaxID=2070463 RepID=UPI001F0E249A|nr:hypothetical protein [Lysinibacillus sp. SGAir0095]
MKRAFLLILIFMVLYPSVPEAVVQNEVKAGFIRGGNLWTLIDGKETQVTDSSMVLSRPQWSKDGTMLVYQVEAPSEIYKGEMQSEVWIYNIKTN